MLCLYSSAWNQNMQIIRPPSYSSVGPMAPPNLQDQWWYNWSLKWKKIQLSKINVVIYSKEEPTVCVVITPTSKVFMAGEMVFMDTNGSCDQTNTCVTFIFAATKIGALPIVVILDKRKLYTLFSICKRLFRGNLPESFSTKNHYNWWQQGRKECLTNSISKQQITPWNTM